MVQFLIVLAIVLFFVSIFFFIIINQQDNEVKKLKIENENLNDCNKMFNEELKKFKREEIVKADNRRKTNEKIDKLHTGDAVSNAINVLRGNKNK